VRRALKPHWEKESRLTQQHNGASANLLGDSPALLADRCLHHMVDGGSHRSSALYTSTRTVSTCGGRFWPSVGALRKLWTPAWPWWRSTFSSVHHKHAEAICQVLQRHPPPWIWSAGLEQCECDRKDLDCGLYHIPLRSPTSSTVPTNGSRFRTPARARRLCCWAEAARSRWNWRPLCACWLATGPLHAVRDG